MGRLRQILKTSVIAAAMSLFIGAALPLSAQAATASQIGEAQNIMTQFGIPTGPVDSVFGPQTAQGLCTFRYISGLPINRNGLDTATLAKLRDYSQTYSSLQDIPVSPISGKSTYLYANQTCQTMAYVVNGYFTAVVPISTGTAAHKTPNGFYSLGGTETGWKCSSQYPQTCASQTAGNFADDSSYGNMYNRRYMGKGGLYLEGATSVPTKPSTLGSIHVSTDVSDWMYDNVGNDGPTLLVVYGKY